MKMSLRMAHVYLGLVALLFTVGAFAADNSRVYVVFKERQKATAKALV